MHKEVSLHKKTALITGASAGIGFALAEVFARHGYDLVLVARNAEALARAKEKFEKESGVSVHVISADLAAPEAPAEVFQKIAVKGLRIDVLVNNAGFAEYGDFHTISLERELGMIALNITALTALTHHFLGSAVQTGHGKILNVASTAAFQPGPRMAVYYATKAYVLSFSEAIRSEVKPLGITVTALCPGPTRTEFFSKQPGMQTSRLISSMGMMTAEKVAEAGYRGLMRGKSVVIPGIKNRLLAWSTRFGPRSLVLAISRWTLEQQ